MDAKQIKRAVKINQDYADKHYPELNMIFHGGFFTSGKWKDHLWIEYRRQSPGIDKSATWTVELRKDSKGSLIATPKKWHEYYLQKQIDNVISNKGGKDETYYAATRDIAREVKR